MLPISPELRHRVESDDAGNREGSKELLALALLQLDCCASETLPHVIACCRSACRVILRGFEPASAERKQQLASDLLAAAYAAVLGTTEHLDMKALSSFVELVNYVLPID